MVDPARLRAEFPVLDRIAYLNAGTAGPLPTAASRAAADVVDLAERDGRRTAYYERFVALQRRQRDAYAALLGCSPHDVALTTSTTDGCAKAVAGLRLGPGDEVVTSDAEHPGLLGALLAAALRDGAEVRTAPLNRLPGLVGPRTRLVACSHVGWARGDMAPPFDLPDDVPLLLDGAQGVGALPVDVEALGCAFYAASGQKWLCGPVGTGMLYVAPRWRDRLVATAFGYPNYTDPARALDVDALHRTAARFDTPGLGAAAAAAAVAAHDVLADAGWSAVHERAGTLAADLAVRLQQSGWRVAARGHSTLVAWEVDDPPAVTERLAAAGVAVRHLPSTPYVRASVGAWNDEGDLERLLASLDPLPRPR